MSDEPRSNEKLKPAQGLPFNFGNGEPVIPYEECYLLDFENSDFWKPEPESWEDLISEDTSKNVATELSIRDDASVDTYFNCALSSLSQRSCRFLTQIFIKSIYPQKHQVCPYTGGEEKKPEWWPADVRHGAPTYLSQDENIKVLIGILYNPEALSMNLLSSVLRAPHLWTSLYDLDVIKEVLAVKDRMLENPAAENSMLVKNTEQRDNQTKGKAAPDSAGCPVLGEFELSQAEDGTTIFLAVEGITVDWQAIRKYST
ncbi:hypothetical protein BO71DRAFT_437907 [Aspergillus ellipticus CBS 707.79]|uniref:Subtelomeric hrmA-associated cluster protein AFUB-079030/YDR124W-like helical bundle domain-containing protein n=1 Tax=Aspergillus ellipticus CBS 707.79 TaxID=1448320 RepID=A0A319F290_9EURO|nr:hypothetical protein BO71DRAFT_437907 [Aspergillus ellipticus CBS 707.79]